MCAAYVNDTLHAGDKDYESMSEETEKTIYWNERNWGDTQFPGLQMETNSNELKLIKEHTLQNKFKSPTKRAEMTFDHYVQSLREHWILFEELAVVQPFFLK